MKEYIREIAARIDRVKLEKDILTLYRLERKQTFPAWQASSRYAYELLRVEGFDAELLEFPADGRTAYQDKCTPLGWDCTKMRLTLVSNVAGIADPVIADYDREPLMAVKGSVSTPSDGLTVRLVTESQMKAGEDVRGAFVLLDPSTRPRLQNMRAVLDLGAYGWVSDYLENPLTTPDAVAWINAGTENNSWHVQAEDRDFISYQITPRTGFYLRAACERGTVMVRAESDGRRYETTLPAVTALLPGQSAREVWMVGHLYEPLIDDNSNGVAGSIELLRVLRELAREGIIRPKYSIRVVFASEMYGFAAVAEHFGDLAERTIGGINMDGIMGSRDKSRNAQLKVMTACDHRGRGLPDGFAGNVLLGAICEEARNVLNFAKIEEKPHILGDDCFLGDANVGLPVVWIIHGPGGYHHNSSQNENSIDTDMNIEHLAFCGAWVRAMATMTQEELTALLPAALEREQKILDEAQVTSAPMGHFLYTRAYNRLAGLRAWGEVPDAVLSRLTAPQVTVKTEQTRRPWFDFADGFVFTRLTRGFPHDLIKLPFTERREMPGTILYSTLADVVSRMDGVKSLRTLLQETEWDTGKPMDERTVKSYLHTCTMLSDTGYFGMTVRNPLTAESLTAALRKLGVCEGDTLLVHSSLSGLGYLSGGTDAIIRALSDAVGTDGTFLTPVFARPYVMFEGTLNKSLNYRPYDTRPDGALRDRMISTGAVPKAMLKIPGVCRSGHATHEWAALGAHAQELTAGHGLLDAPAGKTSPMEKALDADGSVVFLGCSIASNTFLHYIEDCADAPFLQPAVIRYIDAKGTWRTGFIERHLPGHRDFYGAVHKSAFYDEAVRRGLRIDAVPFGMATLYRMRLRELYEIGMGMFRDDPCATLCHDPKCPYCAGYRANNT